MTPENLHFGKQGSNFLSTPRFDGHQTTHPNFLFHVNALYLLEFTKTFNLGTSTSNLSFGLLYEPAPSMNKVPDAWDEEWSSVADVCTQNLFDSAPPLKYDAHIFVESTYTTRAS